MVYWVAANKVTIHCHSFYVQRWHEYFSCGGVLSELCPGGKLILEMVAIH